MCLFFFFLSKVDCFRSREMIDCLLSTEDNDQCKSEMTNMLLCKDNQNKSVLSEYFSRDSGGIPF